MSNDRDYSGEVILRLLDDLSPRPLVDAVKPLYDIANRERKAETKTEFQGAVRACDRALSILEDLYREVLSDTEKLADSTGRCQLLLACIYLNAETELEQAVLHFRASKNTYHSMQWSHLESLACLGLAIAQRKCGRPNNAIVACECAQDSLKSVSIPNAVDVAPLRSAIEKERSEIQELLPRQIPLLSDIAAGLGRIAEENIEKYLKLDEAKRKGVDFGVRVVGDSMAGDKIFDGDIALIRQQPEVELGEIAAVVISTPTESTGVLKRFYICREPRHLQHWFLQSRNPESEHLVVIPNDANVGDVKASYEDDRRSGRIRNEIDFRENAKVDVLGKCVGVLRGDQI